MTFFALVRAIEARDIGTVMWCVYFDEVRKSPTQQLVATYIRRTRAQISPLAHSLAALPWASATRSLIN
jgi:hypothetical protein